MILWVALTAVVAASAGAGIVYVWMRREHGIGSVLWSMQDGILLLDDKNRIVDTNTRFETYTDMAADDVIGMRYNDLLARFDINTTVLDGVDDPRFEIIHNKRILQPVVTVVHDDAQQVTGKVVIFRDVTERSKSQKKLGTRLERLTALRRVHDELSLTLHTQTVLMLALDAAHRLSGAHAGFIALKNAEGQYETAQVIGAYDPDALDKILDDGHSIVQQVIKYEKPLRITNVYQNSDYQLLLPNTRAIIAAPLMLIDGTMMGVMLLSTPYPTRFTEDVFQFIQLLSNRIAATIENARLYERVEKQLKALQQNHEQISRLEKFKTDVIRLAAHDLNNPLSVIMLRTEWLKMLGGLTVKQEEAAQHIQDAAVQMRDLIGTILSLERIDQFVKEGEASFEVVDMHTVIEDTLDDHRNAAQEKSIQLVYTPCPTSPTVRGEPPFLQEAIANLISNAIKYTPEHGSVDVSLEKDGDKVILQVKDSGYGIPENLQPKLFQPFFRANTEETAHIKGTGLGLHLVKKIIDQHGGEMFFQSEYGVGSTFGFRLPAVNEIAEVEAPTP